MKSSKVIKAPRLSARDCVVHSQDSRKGENEAGAEREAVVQEAAEAIIQQRVLEAEEKAFAAGLAEGRASREQWAEQEAELLRSLTQSLSSEFEQAVARMEEGAVETILAMVKKIVGTAGEAGLEVIRQSVRKVMARHSTLGDNLVLHLHPADYQQLAPSAAVMPKNLSMLADDAIERGGCLLETAGGISDARMATQLEELEKALRGQVAAEGLSSRTAAVVESAGEVRSEGRVVNVVGTVVESRGPQVAVGEQCEIVDSHGGVLTRSEVIGFKENRVLLMPLGERHGIGPGNRVLARGQQFTVEVGPHLLGRVLDGLGLPIDGQGPLPRGEAVGIYAQPNNPMERGTIGTPLYTGVRAIDGLLTCGQGGRLGIFAGSGVGKSVLLGMMARQTSADVNVIALIGERGREVREFVERDLGPEGLRRSVVVAVTSDQSPILRIHGAQVAASVAEYFARQGQHVLFMMDSVTRFAMAHREIGLAAGEPPTTKGYTPSSFAALPKLLERSGLFGGRGSITGFYTVLVEGDDMDEPVADHVRSILDGHIVLSRSLASQNHFPAIDVLQSISRLAKQVCPSEAIPWAGAIRNHLAVFHEAQDLVNIGAYVRGSNARIDRALERIEPIRKFLRQELNEPQAPGDVWAQLASLARAEGEARA